MILTQSEWQMSNASERRRVYLQIEALPTGELTGVAVLDAARCVPLAIRQPGSARRQRAVVVDQGGQKRIVYHP